MTRWNELRELTRQRVLTFLRQPEAVFWVFAFPMVLAAVLGFAFKGGKPAPSKVALLSTALTAAAAAAAAAVRASVQTAVSSARTRGSLIDGLPGQ